MSSSVAPDPSIETRRRTSVMAIIAFVAAFVVPVAGLVLGVLARREIDRTQEDGRGLARAAFILGFVFTALQVLFFVVWLGLFITALSHIPR